MNTLKSLINIDYDTIFKAYKQAEPSIKALRWWELWLYVPMAIIGSIWLLYFEYSTRMRSTSVIILFISTYQIGHRIWFKEWFYDWYDWWYIDWAKNSIKKLHKLDDKDIENIEDAETWAEIDKEYEL